MFSYKIAAVAAISTWLVYAGDVNVPDADGTTPLAWAVYNNDLPGVQRLLREGADPKLANRYGVTPLSLAATNRDAAMTEALLKAGADPNAKLPSGTTVLMTAARAGNPEVVRLLVEHGADVNAKGAEYGETALVWAVSENHSEAARVLIAHGADVNARTNAIQREKDRFGLEGVLTILPHGSWTPLMYAAPGFARCGAHTGRCSSETRSRRPRRNHRSAAGHHERPL